MYVAMHDFSSFLEIKIINAVSDFYKERLSKEHKAHVIAALIIEEDGMYSPVILSTGTKYSTKNGIIACSEADYWEICDGHAEAICYRLSVLYLLKEIINIKNNKRSIFELSKGQYKLKETIKFHLLISKRPCGFMVKKASNFLSWKPQSSLHILECSSKILIGSFLGIQGPLHCLLSKPVHISSVLILEDWEEEQEEKPDLSDIKKHFHEFHKKFNESDPDKNIPDVTIRKMNLQAFFNDLGKSKKPPPYCHFAFKAESSTENFCVGDNILSKLLPKLLPKTEFPSLSVENRHLISFLKVLKICNKALEINEAVNHACKNAKEYANNLDNRRKENKRLLSPMLEPKKLYDEQDKQEEREQAKQIFSDILTQKKQIEQDYDTEDYYNKQLKHKTFKCLSEVDCDWFKYINILCTLVRRIIDHHT